MKKQMKFIVGILSFFFFFGCMIYMSSDANAATYQPMDGLDSEVYPVEKIDLEEQSLSEDKEYDSIAASYPYLIKVNKRMNTVTIYAKDSKGNYTKPVKAMVCSTGSATPIGTFKTPAKYLWATLMGPSYGQYSTRIYKGFLFHSVWYYRNRDKSSQSYAQYNRLGTTASHGCVRLTVADAKWIYDKCPLGTTVTIYNSSNPGPLGKPKAYKVPTNRKMGWDPTDPDKANPYKKPPTITISSSKKKEINKGSTYSALQYVTAKSGLGVNLTSKIKVSGTVDTSKLGKYTLTYTVQDSYGNKTSKKFTVSVLNSYPTFSGVKDKTVGLNTTQDLRSGITAKDRDGKSLTSKIKISVIGPNGKSVALKDSKMICSQTGIYKVTYQVAGNLGRSAKKVKNITVQDRRVKLTVSNVTVKAGTTKNIYLGVKSLKNYLNQSLAIDKTNIEVIGNLDLNTPGVYKITYSATEKNYPSRVVKKSVSITVTE